MQQPNIDVLSAEANRLLDLSIQFLNCMNEQKDVIAPAMQGENQTFDQASLAKHIEVLQGEKTKLANLDMVLAVIGTMKAGKSTTINAIIGSEVLPNRNRPMTALPTLIRHTPKQIEPLLKFDNNGPTNQLLEQLSPLLNKPQVATTLAALADNPDMHELLQRIRERKLFSTRYEGADNIFWFLKSLNDLVRLCQELEIAFPFEHYDEVHEMPVIEVEFAHLRHMPETRGRLTLLDTPGPNEAGQTHLRVMMKEQLAKASAILAVMNYGQLKSDADHEVREQLKNIASTAQGRLYALVNKYDEKDRNGDGEEAIKRLVAGTLMKGVIDEAHVFPVSARRAYLANRALHELDLHGKLPPYSKEAWVEDFGEEAIGRRWKNSIDDVEEVREAAMELWQESLFNIPMERVIQTAHSQAAAYAIDAAAWKLIDVSKYVSTYFSTREIVLSKSVDELEIQARALQKDIEKIDRVESEISGLIKNAMKEVHTRMHDATQKSHKSIKVDVDSYFSEGKTPQRLEMEKKQTEEREKKLQKQLADNNKNIFGILKSVSSVFNLDFIRNIPDFKAGSKSVEFDTKEDAEYLLKKIEHSTNEIFHYHGKILATEAETIQTLLHDNISNCIVNLINNLTSEMENRLLKNDINIKIERAELKIHQMDLAKIKLGSNPIKKHTTQHTATKVGSGFFDQTTNLLNDSWGRESYTYTEDTFLIDLKKCQASIKIEANEFTEETKNTLISSIERCINDDTEKYLFEFRKNIESIKNNLKQGITDKKLSKEDQEALKDNILYNKKKINEISNDSLALFDDLHPILQNGA